MTENDSTGSSISDAGASEPWSPFVPLPLRRGDVLRVLGPMPDEAAVAVDPLVKLDEPLTVVRSFVAGVCGPDGWLVLPVEIMLAVDPATVVPNKQVPVAALLKRFRGLSELRAKLAMPTGFGQACVLIGPPERVGPLLYCRKRHRVFAARSPGTGELLRAVPQGQLEDVEGADGNDLSVELLCWDGPATGDQKPAVFGGGGGTSSTGFISSLEQLILGQGKLVELAAALDQKDPVAARRLVAEHACVRCPERTRCYPKDEGHAYAADRLVALSAVEAPLSYAPLGEWRFEDASRMIGGLSPNDCLALTEREENAFESWRSERARVIDSAGPSRLLLGETDGRDLLEVARLKLGLVAEVLQQLDEAWQVCGRPHLCWNAETVRVAWRRPILAPATCWGFQPLLRKAGLQPDSPFEVADGSALPYPPAFSSAAYLSTAAADAARYFDEPRSATMFVKTAKADGDLVNVHVLLEELGVPWELFRTGDTLHAVGAGWRVVLAPAAERHPDDGEGLPFHGRATGNVTGFKKGEQFTGVECRWYPRFGEAVDLHAVGLLLFESLLSHDERSPASLRAELAAETAELAGSCRTLPVEQRDDYVRNWVTERCEADAPAAIWTRRNLLNRRDDRNATRLDAFGAGLWQQIMLFGLRLTTGIAGFSYCADRACAAPRVGEGLLLPLLELRGLIALLDDQLFGRSAPEAAVREAFKEPE